MEPTELTDTVKIICGFDQFVCTGMNIGFHHQPPSETGHRASRCSKLLSFSGPNFQVRGTLKLGFTHSEAYEFLNLEESPDIEKGFSLNMYTGSLPACLHSVQCNYDDEVLDATSHQPHFFLQQLIHHKARSE